MQYKFMRVWSVVKTVIVCGTLCFIVGTIGDSDEKALLPDSLNIKLDSIQMQVDRIHSDLRRHEMALVRIAELRPEFAPALREIYDHARINEKGKVTIPDRP